MAVEVVCLETDRVIPGLQSTEVCDEAYGILRSTAEESGGLAVLIDGEDVIACNGEGTIGAWVSYTEGDDLPALAESSLGG